jgi:hypothetical protein
MVITLYSLNVEPLILPVSADNYAKHGMRLASDWQQWLALLQQWQHQLDHSHNIEWDQFLQENETLSERVLLHQQWFDTLHQQSSSEIQQQYTLLSLQHTQLQYTVQQCLATLRRSLAVYKKQLSINLSNTPAMRPSHAMKPVSSQRLDIQS